MRRKTGKIKEEDSSAAFTPAESNGKSVLGLGDAREGS